MFKNYHIRCKLKFGCVYVHCFNFSKHKRTSVKVSLGSGKFVLGNELNEASSFNGHKDEEQKSQTHLAGITEPYRNRCAFSFFPVKSPGK